MQLKPFKSSFNNIKYTALSFAMILAIETLRALIALRDNIKLPWPGKQLISSVMYMRGELVTDMLAMSSAHSPYYFSAAVLNFFLPFDQAELIATYIILSVLFRCFALLLSVVLLIKTFELIATSLNIFDDKYFGKLSAALHVLFSIIITLTFSSNNILTSMVHGVNVAGWNYPMHDSLNPSGISYILTTLSLILFTRFTENNLSSYIGIVLFGLAAAIHPVVPMFGFIYFSLLLYLTRKGNLFGRLNILLGSIFCIWIAILVIVYITFPQTHIDSHEFFRVYVVNRHPHHYLPSYYISYRIILNLFISLLGGLFLLSFVKHPKIKSLIVELYIFAFLLLFVLHFAQYITVELFNIEIFIKLGISRMSSFYNFAYVLMFMIVLTHLCADSIVHFVNSQLARINLVIATLLILCVFSFGYIHEKIINYFDSQPQVVLSKEVSRHLDRNKYMILTDFNMGDLRELGGFSIFNDNYFPFANEFVLEWDLRRSNKNNFLRCINKNNSIAKCQNELGKYTNIVFISLNDKLKEPPLFVSRIGKIDFYIYKI